ncbi:glycosyltransferase family 2 protein [Patescibacteria group bacterium]|nr:glycosyltransferase family 2 protein [Patescibacteria group bacterium]
MLYSIIIINYKTLQLTKECLTSLFALKDKVNFEIIVVDNASNDGSLEALKEEFNDKIKLIESKINLGFAKANNLAAKIARGEILFFLNSDTVITENIFTNNLELFSKDNNIGIISPSIYTGNNKEQDYYYGKFPTIINLLFKNKAKIKSNNKIIKTNWVSGCSLFIKKDLFNIINGFDENFFLYFEDIDLCKRINDLKYKIIVNKNIKITHLGGKSIKENKKRKKEYYKSQNYYFKKHYNKLTQIIMRILRFPIKILKTL